MLRRGVDVQGRKSILLWVENFRDTDPALKRKPTGRPQNARTPKNAQALQSANTVYGKYRSLFGGCHIQKEMKRKRQPFV